MLRKIGVLLFAVIVAAVCVPTQAVLLTNGGTTVVNENFENYNAGFRPGGDWVAAIGPGGTVGGLVNDATTPDPLPGGAVETMDAFEGTQYLHVHRLGQGIPTETITFDPQTSGTLNLSFMARTGPAGAQWAFVLIDNDDGDRFQLDFQGRTTHIGGAGVYAWNGAAASGGTGIAFLTDWQDDVWKRVDFEYVQGATTATVAIDSGTPVAFAPVGEGASGFDGFTDISTIHFGTTSSFNVALSIDAIPGPAAPCDLTGDTVCDDADIDLLATAVRNGTSDPKFNVDGIGGDVPDDADFDFYITDDSMIGTGHGDADLNLIVNFVDFVSLSNDFGATGTGWARGNFNTDDNTNFNDFVALSNNFGTSFVSDGNNVPEPAAIGALGMLTLVLLRKRH